MLTKETISHHICNASDYLGNISHLASYILCNGTSPIEELNPSTSSLDSKNYIN